MLFFLVTHIQTFAFDLHLSISEAKVERRNYIRVNITAITYIVILDKHKSGYYEPIIRPEAVIPN